MRLHITIDEDKELREAIMKIAHGAVRGWGRKEADAILKEAVGDRVNASVDRLLATQIDAHLRNTLGWGYSNKFKEITAKQVNSMVKDHVQAILDEEFPPEKIRELVRKEIKARVAKLTG